MASPTFDPPKPPQIGTSRGLDQAVDQADFGDGYDQTTASGLNSFRDTVPLVWNAVTVADAELIEVFYRQVGKTDPFWYALPGRSGAAVKWKFTEKLQRDDIDGGLQRVSTTVRQDFTPGD
jgi:phage-related protein